jgi:ectoine hydroxylase-related dioxygenase (phytanoyl-CoA dioxygenase family)
LDFLGGHGFLKPPFCSSQTPWHQDQAYHRADLLFRNVNFWLTLQDCPVESGTMEFAAQSHRGSLVLEHRRPGGDADAHGLELADLALLNNVTACPLPAGGATLHHSYTLHHTPPNDSPIPRRVLIAIFGLPPDQRDEPLHFPWQEAATLAAPGTGPRSTPAAK